MCVENEALTLVSNGSIRWLLTFASMSLLRLLAGSNTASCWPHHKMTLQRFSKTEADRLT